MSMNYQQPRRPLLTRLASPINFIRGNDPIELIKKALLLIVTLLPFGRRFLFEQSLRSVQDRLTQERDLQDILDTVLEIRPGYWPYRVAAVQLRDEIQALARLVQRERPGTILEIGSDEGGTLYIWSRYIESACTLISVDLPGGRGGGGYDKEKTNIFRAFASDKAMHFVRKDSHSAEIFHEVSKMVEEVDFLFIDGDHSYEGVKKDFEMYSRLVSAGGIIALHDIVPHPNRYQIIEERKGGIEDIEERHLQWGAVHPYCEVNRFWKEIIAKYDRTHEIISHPKQSWGGIGVVRV